MCLRCIMGSVGSSVVVTWPTLCTERHWEHTSLTGRLPAARSNPLERFCFCSEHKPSCRLKSPMVLFTHFPVVFVKTLLYLHKHTHWFQWRHQPNRVMVCFIHCSGLCLSSHSRGWWIKVVLVCLSVTGPRCSVSGSLSGAELCLCSRGGGEPYTLLCTSATTDTTPRTSSRPI